MTSADRSRTLTARVLPLIRHKGTLALTDQGIVSATNFGTRIVLGRALLKSDLGLYSLAFTIATLVLNLQASVVATPLTILLPRTPPDERETYIGSTLIHQLVIAGLTALGLGAVAAALIGGWDMKVDSALGPVLGALSLSVVFLLFREYARRVSFANMHMGTAVVLDVVVSVLQLGTLVVLWRTGRLTPPVAFLVMGGACLLGGAGWFVRRRRQFRPSRTRIVPDLKRNFRLGAWVMLYTLAALISSEIYPWLLAKLRSMEATGELHATRTVVFLANPLLIGMGNFLGPRAAHARLEGRAALNSLVMRASLFIGTCMLAFTGLIYLLGDWLLALFYSKYAGLGTVVLILALRHFIASFDAPVNAALLALDRARVVFFSNLVGALIALTAGIYLIDTYGLIGTAWTMVLTTFVVVSLRWIGYLHALRRTFPPPENAGSEENAQP